MFSLTMMFEIHRLLTLVHSSCTAHVSGEQLCIRFDGDDEEQRPITVGGVAVRTGLKQRRRGEGLERTKDMSILLTDQVEILGFDFH